MNYSTDPDVVLMLEFQKGQTRSFETLMHKYYPRVLNFICRYGLSIESAEDLAQETFLKVHQCAASYTPRSKFQTWIFTIARNSALNALRDRPKHTVSLDQEPQEGTGSLHQHIADEGQMNMSQAMIEEEHAARIRAVIDELPENQRTAVLLRRYENFNYEEIAQTMNCSVMAVKSLLSRAKETLKVKLADITKNE